MWNMSTNTTVISVFLIIHLELFIVDLLPIHTNNITIQRYRPKRWAYYEIHKCGRIKGYSCLEHRHCYERYLRHDMVCFEVYPCLSSCIFIAQLYDYEKFAQQVERLMIKGIPVNNHDDAVNFVREKTKKLAKDLNMSLPLGGI
ncbi:hypothetical protein MS3_00002929 [Schistosoma haematobium]|uniref:Uncharacterized protein n=2 Tax=Schistosoma TaxID=6181 RepID=A0A922S1R8_SCHHA|nr:hypothetical protein MS3_00002929 [Schistosoma haematobium]CAH8608913.1 unnamed protein product [Schistosoma mattheei]CAH8635336.1 unnamed protein product [Schistosoma bovis]CAH8635845.1 unnamed protein product [Schistosoma curassoni]KAH9590119.1 hypothetical protein MS3_00002929 [Schistosoma haematobium]CAH8651063.1 unnamed protein product [Schistosoma haematobium]